MVWPCGTATGTGNLTDPTKWDTGVVPDANTTIVMLDHPLYGNTIELNGANVNLAGVSLYSGSIIDTPGTGKITSATTINVESGTISAKLDGTTGLYKTTAGSVTLSGANVFSGGVTVDAAGTLTLGNNSASAHLQMY